MISVAADFDKTLSAARKRVSSAMRDVRRDGGRFAKKLRKDMDMFDAAQNKKNFSTQGKASRDGKPATGSWKKLSKEYAKAKLKIRKRLGFSGRGKILNLSGSLRESLTQRDKHRIARTRRGVIELGSNHFLAAIHQKGAKIKRRGGGRSVTAIPGLPVVSARTLFGGTINLPARPPVRKGRKQTRNLKSRLAKTLLQEFERVSSGQMKRAFGRMARRLRPKAAAL